MKAYKFTDYVGAIQDMRFSFIEIVYGSVEEFLNCIADIEIDEVKAGRPNSYHKDEFYIKYKRLKEDQAITPEELRDILLGYNYQINTSFGLTDYHGDGILGKQKIEEVGRGDAILELFFNESDVTELMVDMVHGFEEAQGYTEKQNFLDTAKLFIDRIDDLMHEARLWEILYMINNK